MVLSFDLSQTGQAPFDLEVIMTQPCELGVECLQTNYYGARRMVEALLPLLQLSQSPRIVNISSLTGKLEVQNLLICFFK